MDPNEFSLNYFYRNRLVRCYLGARRGDDRCKHPFTGFDFADDLKFTDLYVKSNKGPMPIVNATLNLGASSDLALHSRRSANFVFTPSYAGCGQKGHEGFRDANNFYQPERGLTLGTAVAISGAAASPNTGSHSSASVSFLLTLFNLRQGWWVPNTRLKSGESGPLLGFVALLSELFGLAGDQGRYVYLSDGGHFENLGLYELVRRKCRLIIVGDGEQDDKLTFGSLGNVIRLCEVDFDAQITLDVSAIRNRDGRGFSAAHCAVGEVKYGDGNYGTIVYLKSSMTGNEPTELHQYKADHPAFPHESTVDQFFSEEQFESYRKLGAHIAETALAHATGRDDAFNRNGLRSEQLEEFCISLRKRWFPAKTDRAAFMRHTATLNSLWEALRKDNDLQFLDEQFFPSWQNVAQPPAASRTQAPASDPLDLPTDPIQFRKAFYYCTELIQLMENAYLDFDLETNESSPDLRGWMNLFRHWTWSFMFRATWALASPTYGAQFQLFCERVFGLTPVRPGGGGGGGIPDAISLRLLTGDDAEALLNPVERRIVASMSANLLGRSDVTLYVLTLEVAHPMDKKKTRRIPTGFALCSGKTLLYLRIQDHLRQTGLGEAFLDALVKGDSKEGREGIKTVQPIERKNRPEDPRTKEEKEEFEAWVKRRYPDLKFQETQAGEKQDR